MKELRGSTISYWNKEISVEMTIRERQSLGSLDLLVLALQEVIEQTRLRSLQCTPPEFYTRLLTAVARHYAVNAGPEQPVTLHDLLLDLIANLAKGGVLETVVDYAAENKKEDDEWFDALAQSLFNPDGSETSG